MDNGPSKTWDEEEQVSAHQEGMLSRPRGQQQFGLQFIAIVFGIWLILFIVLMLIPLFGTTGDLPLPVHLVFLITLFARISLENVPETSARNRLKTDQKQFGGSSQGYGNSSRVGGETRHQEEDFARELEKLLKTE